MANIMTIYKKLVTVNITKLEYSMVSNAMTLAPRPFLMFCATCNKTAK